MYRRSFSAPTGSPFASPGPRLRRLAARRRVRRLLLLAALLSSALALMAQLQAAADARRRGGETRLAAVARRDLAIGEQIDAGAVELRQVPAAAVPEGALVHLPLGSVVRYPIAAGEAVLSKRIAPEGLSGVAALVPEGEVAVAVPVTPAGRPPLQLGDQVDVLAVVATPEQPDATPAAPLATGALVVDVGDESVSIAVPRSEAPLLAYAITQGAAVLALGGP
jgi:Flp pilus assembly protein CpaB